MPTYSLEDSGCTAFGSLHTRLPALVTVRPSETDADPLPCEVDISLDLDAGRLVARSCLVRDSEVTTELFRRIPVGRWLREAVAELRLVEDVDGPLPDDVSSSDLLAVARIYRWANATGDAPLGLLERRYGVSRSRGSRWITTARRRGLL